MRKHQPEINCIWNGRNILGEGPVYSRQKQGLYWVDIKGCKFHFMDLLTHSVKIFPVRESIGWIFERNAGGLICGLKSGFAFVDPENLEITPIGDPEPNLPDNRLNDAKVDSEGYIWAGSMDDLETNPSGSLYRLSPDLNWQHKDSGYVVSNGPAHHPAGNILYHTSSSTREIYAFDLSENGELSNKRLHIEFDKDEGYPDGMTCDSEGGLWVAHWDGWCISRYLDNGELDFRIDMPIQRPTSLCFGGSNLDELFVTSASVNLSPDELSRQPDAGGLFHIEIGFKGMAPTLFGG